MSSKDFRKRNVLWNKLSENCSTETLGNEKKKTFKKLKAFQ